MKHLGISGGGTKISGLFGAAEAIIYEKNYQPDIISGVSAGAILTVPLALGLRDEIKDLVLHFKTSSFFNDSPYKANGKLRVLHALWKIIRGKHYLGEQKNLERTLSKVVTPERFEQFKSDDAIPFCIIAAVDFYTGKRFYMNLKTVSYELYLKLTNASASLPVFTPGIPLEQVPEDFEGKAYPDKVLLYDGGVRDHSPTHKVLQSDQYRITETCTIFSRPQDFKEILSPGFQANNIMHVLSRYVDISNAEISKNDATEELEVISRKGIQDHGTIYLPKIIKGVYDIHPEDLRKLYQLAGEKVQEYWVE